MRDVARISDQGMSPFLLLGRGWTRILYFAPELILVDRVSSHEPRMLPWIGVFTMGLVFRVFRLVAGWWLVAGRLPGCLILYWLGIGWGLVGDRI